MPLQNLISSKPALLAIVIVTGLLYIPLNRRGSKHYWESKIDAKIPLIPFFIIPYIWIFFPYLVIGPILLWNSPVLISFLKSFIVANTIAFIIWHFFPNGVRRPIVKVDGFWKKMINNLYKVDKYDTNGFPSYHVYYTSIITWYLVLALPQYSEAFWFTGILIILSTLFTKQHYLIDVVGGLGLSALSILVIN